ncbi:DUF3077 domain-containing protein [Pseudomonas sp.]|uniref:DUF3077 domain-containing protein n=1 Tax=Pseudomonas sp. TaxID=306 RepID=UPI001B0BAFA9|nr:DUF3077 domain-containing protein [Pseudomonas sp.]MBO9550664.1 DUF3077 domain-containing protein [Pseudomonas sp.]
MQKNEIAATAYAGNPDNRYGLDRQLFSTTPGIAVIDAKEQATKIMECARYLNHTGVMLGNHRRLAASYHLNVMVRVLVDDIQK